MQRFLPRVLATAILTLVASPSFNLNAQGRDRTGYNAAAYRMVIQGWSADAAITEMSTFHFNKIWVGNPGFLKDFKQAKLD